MKHPKLWDSISTILVLFGFGLYGSSCWYGVWALVYAALGCVVLGALIAVCTQRCPFCHRYLGMMFFSGKKTYCPHCGSDVHAGHLSRVNAQKSKNNFQEARMRAISSRKSCSEHR